MTDALARPPGPKPTRTPWAFAAYVKAISADPIGFVGRRFETYGDMYYAPLRDNHLYVTRHPAHIDQVLVKNARSFKKTEVGNAAKVLRKFLGVGLLNANGDVWRRQRRMIQPALNRSKIAGYGETMVVRAADHVGGWTAEQPVELTSEMSRLTLGIVSEILFAVDMADTAGDATGAIDAFRDVMRSPPFLPDWLPTKTNRRSRRALANINQIMQDLVDERRAQGPEEIGGRSDLLSALVLATDDEDPGATMNDRQLRDEMLTMFFAGHETTSLALTWTMYLLSQHPEVEAGIVAQIEEVAGGRALTASDVPALTLCEQAINESMRIFPPVFTTSRTAVEDVEVGDHTVPQGAEILTWMYWAHHDARWFEDPKAFRPERFAPGAAEIPAGAFVPFGAGQRVCIGKHFAMMEAVLILATVLRRWHLDLVPGHPVAPRPAVTLTPQHGMMMIPRRR